MVDVISYAGFTASGMMVTFLIMIEVADTAMRARDKLPLLVFGVVAAWIMTAMAAAYVGQWLVVVATVLMIAAGVAGWLFAKAVNRTPSRPSLY